jgi:hypothetical protein
MSDRFFGFFLVIVIPLVALACLTLPALLGR